MIKKIFPIIAFMLCCCNEIVLNAQYSTREFLDSPSYIGGVPIDEGFVNEMANSNNNFAFFAQASSQICYDDYGDPVEYMGGGTCEDGGLHSSDPGNVPIGDAYCFWIVMAALYGLRGFYKRKKMVKVHSQS